MNATFLLITSLTLQETLLAHYSIFQARQAGITWMEIHLIWTVITLIHLFLPYLLGTFLIIRNKNAHITRFLTNIETKLDLKRNSGNAVFLVLFGIVNYVYLNSFAMGLLKIKDARAFFYIFLGDFIWYLLIVSASLKNVNILLNIKSLVLAALVVFVCMYILKSLLKKVSKKG